MHVGVALPVTLDPDAPADLPAALLRYARHAEELGFASLWVTDHLLTGHAIYAVPRLEPMATLMHLAGATTLCAGAYTPGRRMMRTSPGFAPPSRSSTPASLAPAAPLTANCESSDCLESVWMPTRAWCGPVLLTRRTSATIQLVPPSGCSPTSAPTRSQSPFIGSTNAPNPPVLAPSVRRRVVRAAGWIPRPTGTVDQLASDWREIRAEMAAQGRDPATLARALKVYVHMVDTGDRAKAYAIQEPLVRRVVSSQFPWPYLTQIICVGTPQDCVDLLRRKIEAVAAAEVILGDYVLDERQLDLWAGKLLPHLH
ncbi:MAG: LLM class flavin-dependent oxidoreductase [Chloroflexi bacterium]|nr:LLM class flavin-dependent oxidoreductase [Chloroflexota bacterium]